jgi:uncharacterized membrane protein YoaK (UPF0700 family)
MVENLPYKQSLKTGALLASTAGFVDSYTFAFHNERFASFQSGNLIQLAINLMRGHWQAAILFVVPIAFFLIGSALNQILKYIAVGQRIPWEELSVGVEIIGLITAAILEITHTSSMLVLSVLATTLAIQADTFSKIRNMPYATIMSTGNLKTLGATFTNGIIKHSSEDFGKARNIGLVILAFVTGAAFAELLGRWIGPFALLYAPIAIGGVFVLVWQDHAVEMQKLK